jgi:hypothetical protein
MTKQGCPGNTFPPLSFAFFHANVAAVTQAGDGESIDLLNK